jgi:hypothetical protein
LWAGAEVSRSPRLATTFRGMSARAAEAPVRLSLGQCGGIGEQIYAPEGLKGMPVPEAMTKGDYPGPHGLSAHQAGTDPERR